MKLIDYNFLYREIATRDFYYCIIFLLSYIIQGGPYGHVLSYIDIEFEVGLHTINPPLHNKYRVGLVVCQWVGLT